MKIYFILFIFCIPAIVLSQDCKWGINADLPLYQPLYIKPTSGSLDIHSFWLPQVDDIVTVPYGQQVLFACVGGGILYATNTEEATLTCNGGTNWKNPTNNAIYPWSNLYCNKHTSQIARYTGTPCDIPGPYNLTEIGFKLTSNGKFYTLMKTCFNYATSDSIYTFMIQTPEIRGYQSNFPRPGFIQGTGFYPSGLGVDNLYSQTSQYDVMSKLLGSNDTASKYIKSNTDFYMSRGHFAAKCDFVYGSHQRATFWFLNAAPQWSCFNEGNWLALEDSVRNFISTRNADVHIYTGSHGIAKLPDINNVNKPIYLTTSQQLKCPYIFWKVLYEPSTKKGVAFVGMNNPYIDNPGNDFYFCSNVCDLLSWVNWQPNNQTKGYAYCCEVPALRKFIPEIPSLNVTSLLS